VMMDFIIFIPSSVQNLKFYISVYVEAEAVIPMHMTL